MAIMFNSVVRLPVIFAGATATLVAGEAVRRVFAACLNTMMGNKPVNDQDYTTNNPIKAKIWEVSCPFAKVDPKDLAIAGIVAVLFCAVGTELCNLALGQAPNTYNLMNRWISPLLLDTQWRHPIIKEILG